MGPAHRLELERRIAVAIRRIGDGAVIARVGATLAGPDIADVFALLTSNDFRVRTAAHECVVLRLSRIAAAVARVFAFDDYQRDELVQRTFVELPAAIARAASRGEQIDAPEPWVRRRSYFVARQILREEIGSRSRGVDANDRVRTRGRRVSTDVIDRELATDPDTVAADLDRHIESRRVEAALRTLAAERPLWAELLRLHYLQGHELNEVATRLGRSHGTVRNDAQRARARLEAIIREQHPQLVPPSVREEDRNALP